MNSHVITVAEERPQTKPQLQLLWLEITGKCQLACGHCYAKSGPDGDHGVMQDADWVRVIDQAARLGVGMIQFIGGEPTLHPALAQLIDRALGHAIEVEVYSNLVHVSDALWEVFARPGVHLATSYYSDDSGEHARIVGGRPTHPRTEANILRARGLGIPLRAGLVRIFEEQRIEAAIARLRELGVEKVRTDDLRGVGRGTTDTPKLDALCGRCVSGRLVIMPTGDAHPCVFSRWKQMRVGNVREQTLEAILTGQSLASARATIAAAKGVASSGPCDPNDDTCGPDCDPQNLCGPLKVAATGPASSGPCDPNDDTCGPDCDPQNLCGPLKVAATGPASSGGVSPGHLSSV